MKTGRIYVKLDDIIIQGLKMGNFCTMW